MSREIWDLVDLAQFADKGVMPVQGGTLDQTDAFLSFLSIWRATTSRLKAEAHGED